MSVKNNLREKKGCVGRGFPDAPSNLIRINPMPLKSNAQRVKDAAPYKKCS